MTKSKLSDEEQTSLSEFVVTQNVSGATNYINKLLYERGLGSDACSRPFAARDADDIKENCFAKGYLKKILSFIESSNNQMSDGLVVIETIKYVRKLIKEIDIHFEKKEPTHV